MTQISVQGSLSDPPVFGDCVRMLIGGPLMVVVDANPPPPESDRTSCVAVCYLDDCALLHSERVPWGLLEPCSLELLAKERAERCQELDAELSVRETTRTNARLKVIHDAVASSSDPSSLFGLLRNAVLSVLRAGFEVDDRGSPEDVAARESGMTVEHEDPLAGTLGASMSCLSQSELAEDVSEASGSGQTVPDCSGTYVSVDGVRERLGEDLLNRSTPEDQNPGVSFTPHTHF